MSATQTEKIGFVRSELDFLVKYRTGLQTGGIDVDEFHRVLTEKIDRATRANAKQESLKAETRRATAEAEAASDDVYRTGSGFLDAAMGVLGKNSPEAQVLQRLRSRIRQPGDQTAEVPGGPAPGSPA